MYFCQKLLFCKFLTVLLVIRRRKKKKKNSSHETSQTSAQSGLGSDSFRLELLLRFVVDFLGFNWIGHVHLNGLKRYFELGFKLIEFNFNWMHEFGQSKVQYEFYRNWKIITIFDHFNVSYVDFPLRKILSQFDQNLIGWTINFLTKLTENFG